MNSFPKKKRLSLNTCTDCNTRVSTSQTIRCRKCHNIFNVGLNNAGYKSVVVECDNCKKEYTMHRFRLKNYKLHFCSSKCKYSDTRMSPVIQNTKPFLKGFTSWNKGIPHTKEAKKKMSEAMIGKMVGKDNPSYKHGLTPLINKIRRLSEYKIWQKQIFKRDAYTCRKCKVEKKSKICAHHLKSFAYLIFLLKIVSIEKAVSCRKLWDINNGVVLCKDCHTQTSNYSNKAKKNPIDNVVYI